MNYLIDTNCFIYHFKDCQQKFSQWFNNIPKENILLSCFVYLELAEGYINRNSKRGMEMLQLMLESYKFLKFDDSDTILSAKLRSLLRKQGKIITSFDVLIASQAINRNLTLVTFNKKDFENIPELKLKVFEFEE